MLFHAEEKTVRIPGGEVTYVAFGSGEKPLVIIPGLSLRPIHGSALPLAWMYRLFCPEYRVYVIDKRADVPKGCTISGLAYDMAETMRAIGIPRAAVVGISQGGMIAQYLAVQSPEMVDRLVLGVTLSRTNDTVRAILGKWIEDAAQGDFESIVQDMLDKMYSPQYVRKYGRLFPAVLRLVKLDEMERFIRLAESCLTCDIYERLPEIRCPVLVLGGQEDRIVTARASAEIAEKIGCPVYLYEGLGHSAYEEAKDFNQRIYDFLRQAPAGPDGRREGNLST